jgi:hypothetical protein
MAKDHDVPRGMLRPPPLPGQRVAEAPGDPIPPLLDAENRLRRYHLDEADERRRDQVIERAWKIGHAGRQAAMFMALVGLSQVLLNGLVIYNLGLATVMSNAVVLYLLGLSYFYRHRAADSCTFSFAHGAME